MEHVVSFPFYDLSFYKVPTRVEETFLQLGDVIHVYKGASFYVAGYSVIDSHMSKSKEEDVLITPGAITRCLSCYGSDFIIGAYKSCRGSSGGAILTKGGNLIGMHLQNEFYEDSTYHSMSEGSYACLDDYKIKAPKTFFRYGRRIDHAANQFNAADALRLSRYAASNVVHKSSFGVFLSVGVIKKKVDALLMKAEVV